MVVYLVTSGSYSDYAVEGIFSTEEKAQEYIDTMVRAGRRNEFNEIEPTRVDELVGASIGSLWEITINMIDGSSVTLPYENENAVIHPDRRCQITGPFGNPPFLRVSSPFSVEHAMKVAAEKRQEWLRTQAITR